MDVIVGLSGVARSGKDAAADCLVKRLGFVRQSVPDVLREVLEAVNPIVAFGDDGPIRYVDALGFYGYEFAKDVLPEFRAVMQRLGGGRCSRCAGFGFGLVRSSSCSRGAVRC